MRWVILTLFYRWGDYMICLGSHHWYMVVRRFKPSLCGFFRVCVLNHVLYCPLEGQQITGGTVLPWSYLMVGVGVRMRDLREWPRNDEVIAFPLRDSSVDKLRKLWVLFYLMLRGRGYIH